MNGRQTWRTTDYHTGGEPFRILEGEWEIEGTTVAERRVSALSDPRIQAVRQTLCFEPRGHADMYGGFIVPPDDTGAHFGVLFWHKDGFSTACGHGTIALGAWAVESGRVSAAPSGTTEVVIDVPSGRVKARVHMVDGLIRDIDFINVPSYAVALDVPLSTSFGNLRVDLGFGGAMYAQVNCTQLGWKVGTHDLNAMIALGREIRDLLNSTSLAAHSDDRLSGVYGTIFYEESGGSADALEQVNVTIFADGEVDRSPCGSGTASRLAVLWARGQMSVSRMLRHRSITGALFIARGIEAETSAPSGFPAIVPSITGTAYLTGRHEFIVDPRDDLVPGFVLR